MRFAISRAGRFFKDNSLQSDASQLHAAEPCIDAWGSNAAA